MIAILDDQQTNCKTRALDATLVEGVKGAADRCKANFDQPNGVELPEGLQRAADALRHAAIPDPIQRVISVFLGSDAFRPAGRSEGGLMGDLLLESLPRFVAARGGQIAHSMAFRENGDPTFATFKHVTIDAERRPILKHGLLFLDMNGPRVVVSVKRAVFGPRQEECNIKLMTDTGSASETFTAWEEFTRQDNFLRGKAFFADGNPLPPRARRLTWEDVVLPESVLRTVRLHVEKFLRHRDRLADLGVKTRRGLMFAGPPGTGKTLLCKVMGDVLGCSFLWVTPRHLRCPWSFEEVLKIARFVTPTVLLLDDIDLYAQRRHGSESSMMLGELMAQLDGALDNPGLITIATTNRLAVVERALRNRPGRFDRVIRFDFLDEQCRRRLLERLLDRADVAESELAFLAHHTYSYTGAQLEELTNTLYMLAVEAGDAIGRTAIDRRLVELALREVSVERKTRIGF